MKHQQVVVDYWRMFKTSFMFVFLAIAGYVLLKLVQTVFWLPTHLKQNQQRLEELAARYSLDINSVIEENKSDGKLSDLIEHTDEGAASASASDVEQSETEMNAKESKTLIAAEEKKKDI